MRLGRIMGDSAMARPSCGSAQVRKHGLDRQGRQFQWCRSCRRNVTTRTGTPFSGYRFPPDLIALAVRWCVRYQPRYADVAVVGLLGDASAMFDWVREFVLLCEGGGAHFPARLG